MSSAARIAATVGSPTTRVATAITRSARARRRETGLPRARPICCRSITSTWSSPCRDRPDRLPEQDGGLRSAVPHSGRDAAYHRRRSQTPRCPHRLHRRAPHLGLGDDPPSASPHDRAGRRGIIRRYALGALPTRFPVAGAGAVPPVPAALPDRARRCLRGGPAVVLRRSRRPAPSGRLRRIPRAAEEEELVHLRQAALRR